ncbi:MAG: hypothetical protein C4538_12990 [Nitrospiraceae bacterium]|nr:MAG: hypothetical protein C4538_12990 [Nitrospiraceae bacterium]
MSRNLPYCIYISLLTILILFGIFSGASAQTCTDNDNDGYSIQGGACGPVDCDDTDSRVFPGAQRICDGKDNDCDGRTDFSTDVDKDKDGVPWCAGDCDDNNANRYPGNTELYGSPKCSDGIDNDCNSRIDSSDPNCQNPCPDKDKDGYGNPGSPFCANGPATDCNDNDPAISPGAPDTTCNGIDENCSGLPDEGFVPAPTNCGVGACASTGQGICQSGTIVNTCTPGTPQAEGPFGSPTCSDGLDNDCDSKADAADNSCATPCLDNDGDGYGANGDPSCPNGTSVDCNDNDVNINPGAPDATCNGVDENCNGTADDQYIAASISCGVGACTREGQSICQNGTIVNTCTPGTPQAEGPFGSTSCNDGVDNNCNGLTDAFDTVSCSSKDVDTDQDGFTPNQSDCDDTDSKVYPGAPRICDGKDNDCDGRTDFSTDVDKDKDGVPWCAGDCDDNNSLRSPQITEGPFGAPQCSDLIDNDCDNKVDAIDPDCQNPCLDKDKDGYGNPGSSYCPRGAATDCNDKNASINPGVVDNNCNGIDENCSGTADEGFMPVPTNCGVGACGSTGQDVCQGGNMLNTCVPGAPQQEGTLGNPTCSDGIDNNCNGLSDVSDPKCLTACIDNDGDGYGVNGDPSCTKGSAVDCNDSNPNINPGAPDANCNGIDENCSGTSDDGYAAAATSCGLGICTRTGQKTCQLGAIVDTCIAGTPQTEGPPGNPNCSDGLDNNCNGLADMADNAFCNPLNVDNDGDGYCETGPCMGGAAPGDCDDTDKYVFPGAPRICDGKDNDCDGRRDFSTDVDNDRDGYALCKGDCNDNNPDVNPGKKEGPYGTATCSDGWDNDCNGRTDASDPNCAAPTCGTKTSPKNGPHFFTLMNPDGTVNANSGALDCGKCHNPNNFQDNTRYQCQRCHADIADTTDTLNGTLKAQYPLNMPYGYGSAPNVKLHSSAVAGTKYGTWNPGCITCHNPHQEEQDLRYGTNYGMYLKEYVCFDNTATGQHLEGLIQFTAQSGPGSFADGPPYNSNICEMCHTRTNHHRRDGSAPGDKDQAGIYAGHYDGNNCTACHSHSDGFKPSVSMPAPHNAQDCATCHVTQDTYVANANIPNSACDTCHGTGSTGGSSLKIDRHFSSTYTDPSTGTLMDIKCVECHNPMSVQTNFRGNTNLKFIRSIIRGNNIAFEAYSGQYSFADDANKPADMTTANYVCNTCHSQTNHHQSDGTAPGGQSHNDGANCASCHPHASGFKPSGGACGSCHDVPPPTGTHLKHFGGTIDQAVYGSTSITPDIISQSTVYIMNCGNCHPMDISKHMNGVTNSGGGSAEIELYNPSAPAGSLKALNPPAAFYTPGTSVYADSKGMLYTMGTCSNVYCHSYTKTVTSGEVPLPTVPPYYPPLVYNPPWESLVVKTTEYKNPQWGMGSLNCSGCHGNPTMTSYPTVSAGAGDSHGWTDNFGFISLHVWNMGFAPLQCYTCHSDTVKAGATWSRTEFSIVYGNVPIYNAAKHVNGKKDVVFDLAHGYYSGNVKLTGAAFDPVTKNCSNIICHGPQSPVKWGTPYRSWNGYECNVCHQW